MSKVKTETAVTKIEGYSIIRADGAEMREVVAANIGADSVSAFDLERVRVPAGGGRTWQLPDGDSQMLEGVIIGWRSPRAYWSQSFEGGGAPPDCSSADGVRGVGQPGGECHSCPMAQWGSAAKGDKPGRGQACKSMRLLFLLRPEDTLPLVVVIPPSSLSDIKRYFLRLVNRRLPHWAVVTALELSQDKNKDGITFSRVTPAALKPLDQETASAMKAYAEQLGPLMAATQATPDEMSD